MDAFLTSLLVVMFDYFWFQAIIPTPEGYCNILQALESAEAYDKLRTIWNGELTI